MKQLVKLNPALIFENAVEEYNRRVSRGMSKSYISTQWRVVRELWDETATWAKKWVFDPIARTVEKVAQVVRKVVRGVRGVSKYDQYIVYNTAYKAKVQCFYALYIRSVLDGKIFAAKIGTSKNIVTRLRQEIEYYSKAYDKQVKIEVVHFVEHDDHAHTIANESFFRWAFCERYPDYFKDNDRFTTLEIGLEEIHEVEKLMYDTRKKLLGGA